MLGAALMEMSGGQMCVKGQKGGTWQNQWHLSHCTPPYFSSPHVLDFCRPLRHSLAPRLLFLSSSPLLYRFFPLSCPFLLFLTYFWHRPHSNFGQKRAQKRDRWRDESRRSRRQMEGEREDGRRRKEQSLLFLAAGPSYFILLYNRYSFYITITVAPWH